MSTFQILMFAATLFFAYQIYQHVQTLEDKTLENEPSREGDSAVFSAESLVEEADDAYERGETERAQSILEEAHRMESENPEIINKLAYVTAKNGDRLKGIQLYERSLELDENDDLTHNAIASLYRSERAYERAQDHYLKALEIDDQYSQTYFNYGNLLADMGNIEDARTMYKRALELQNDFPQACEALLSLGEKI